MKFNSDGLMAIDLAEIKKMHTDTLRDLYMISIDSIQKMLIEEIFKLRGISLPMSPELVDPPKRYA